MEMRDTRYAREETPPAVYVFPSGSEARIERLFNHERKQIEIRFSWWKDGKMIPRPLDATEQEFVALMQDAIKKEIFSEETLARLHSIFGQARSPSN